MKTQYKIIATAVSVVLITATPAVFAAKTEGDVIVQSSVSGLNVSGGKFNGGESSLHSTVNILANDKFVCAVTINVDKASQNPRGIYGCPTDAMNPPTKCLPAPSFLSQRCSSKVNTNCVSITNKSNKYKCSIGLVSYAYDGAEFNARVGVYLDSASQTNFLQKGSKEPFNCPTLTSASKQ